MFDHEKRTKKMQFRFILDRFEKSNHVFTLTSKPTGFWKRKRNQEKKLEGSEFIERN